jgi:hypothetical protein
MASGSEPEKFFGVTDSGVFRNLEGGQSKYFTTSFLRTQTNLQKLPSKKF